MGDGYDNTLQAIMTGKDPATAFKDLQAMAETIAEKEKSGEPVSVS